MVYRFILQILIFFLLTSHSTGQSDSLLGVKIDPILFTSTKIKSSQTSTPLAIQKVMTNDSLKPHSQNISINEHLATVPGLFALNARNYAQDLRISIRGFGARSSFGIRGVKLIVDGIPETTPDGQGQVDNLDLSIIENIEVIRGPSSGLYGNASGGVVNISTKRRVHKNFTSINFSHGAFETYRGNVQIGRKFKSTEFVLSSTYLITTGHRDYSRNEQTNLNLNVFQKITKNHELNLIGNILLSPKAFDPGALTLDEVTDLETRYNARDRNREFRTIERVDQLKIALQYEYKRNEKAFIKSQFFYSKREFNTRLPFSEGGGVALDRTYWGHNSSINIRASGPKSNNHLVLGFEILNQFDDRKRWVNNMGFLEEALSCQDQSYINTSLFAVDKYTIKDKWHFMADLRLDLNKIQLTNRFPNIPSPDPVSMNAINYGLGGIFNYREEINPFLRVSTSFETPTLNELSSDPSGGLELNSDLRPQRSINFDLGSKGRIHKRINYDITAFYIQTRNEIVSYEIEDFPDKDFFRNAGKTNRKGLEARLLYSVTDNLNIELYYTLASFKFEDYQIGNEILDGQNLPGLPGQYGGANFSYSNSGIKFNWNVNYVGELFAEDLNQVVIDSYFKHDFRVNYDVLWGKRIFSTYFGINNVLDALYNDNIRINAFGGRYYEAAPFRNFFLGLKFEL